MIKWTNKAFKPISKQEQNGKLIIKGEYLALGHVGGMEIDGKYQGGKEVTFTAGIGYKTIRNKLQERLDRISKRVNVSSRPTTESSTPHTQII